MSFIVQAFFLLLCGVRLNLAVFIHIRDICEFACSRRIVRYMCFLIHVFTVRPLFFLRWFFPANMVCGLMSLVIVVLL